jgi:ATP-binding cassette subfamily B protein
VDGGGVAAIGVGTGGGGRGNVGAGLACGMQVVRAVLMAVFMFILVPRAAVSADRIQEVLTIAPTILDPQVPTVMPTVLAAHANGSGPTSPTIAGTVEFRNVEFRYPGAEQPVLHDISFTAQPGETTAIVGSTGSGKTTLVNLIPRFYDVTGGALLVDGVDVRQMTREDLWQRIGVIPQRAFLFSGTVSSNLRYGDESADDEALWHALEIAQGKTFVGEMEGELEAPIVKGGTNVSGGQRQRLAIARALVKRAPIYIFDDSFSALDFKTDAQLRAALQKELASATVLIVAQRVGTIMKADRIVVMDEGRIVGIGRHHDLLETCETYREIVFSQLTAAEAQAA